MDTHATSFRYMKSSKEVWWVVPSLMFVTFTGTPGADRERAQWASRLGLNRAACAHHPTLSLHPHRLKWM